MTDQTKPVARPGETLVHLHFINPDTNDRSTWIGTSAHRALLRDADGRLNLEVMIDVDGEPAAPVPQVEGQTVIALVPGRQDTAAGTRTCTGCDGTGERRDFNTDGDLESVERCGGCDGTGRVAIDAESGAAR